MTKRDFFACASDAPEGFNSSLVRIPPVDVFCEFPLQKAKTESKHFITMIFCCVGCSVYCLRSVANGDSKKVFFVLFAFFFTAKTREEAVPCFNLTPF